MFLCYGQWRNICELSIEDRALLRLDPNLDVWLVAGKDEHDVRKQEEVLQECLMMVPDCQRRLVKAYDELKAIIDSEVDLQGNDDYLAAVKVLEDAKSQLPSPGETLHHFC